MVLMELSTELKLWIIAMTMLKPTIIIQRLLVYSNQKVALDQPFNPGVNILSGHNSSGKTTILDFIAYTLGAENVPWKPEALLCTDSYLEIKLNKNIATLKRKVDNSSRNEVSFFMGKLDAALQAPANDWKIYPFSRSEKLSFTQVILNLLDLPEAQGEAASNLTMHQFLRIIYADQPSLHSPIFKFDAFDSSLLRENVAHYLLGFYNDELYNSQLEKRKLEKQLNIILSEIKAILVVTGRSNINVNAISIENELTEAINKKIDIENQLKETKSSDHKFTASKQNTEANKIRKDLDQLQSELNEYIEEKNRLELTQLDSTNFIKELRSRLDSIQDSQFTRSKVNLMKFEFCPFCLSEITHNNEDTNSCHLCKTPQSNDESNSPLLKMKNELQLQLNESTKIFEKRNSKKELIDSQIASVKSNIQVLSTKYKLFSTRWSTDTENKIEKLSLEIGKLTHEISSLEKMKILALNVSKLQNDRDTLQSTISKFEDSIESLSRQSDARKYEIYTYLSDTLKRLLKYDLNRQIEFQNPAQIDISFTDNKILINGTPEFSESSTAVLRHLFHLALLSISTKLPYLRFPRLLLLDGIEDGGMELARSYNLQKIIVDECATFKNEFQLIFASSQVSPELENYIVGREFTEKQRSLDINQNSILT